jgi:hypothetical protein
MNDEQIPIPCNCAYRREMFKDLGAVWEKYLQSHEVRAHAFAYSIVQLATLLLKQDNTNDQQIVEFFYEAMNSVQLRENHVNGSSETEVES